LKINTRNCFAIVKQDDIGSGAPHTIAIDSKEESVSSYLDELFAHQAWADAEHWLAFEAFPAALAKTIRERLLSHSHRATCVLMGNESRAI
jgi:hypothetical protein